MKNKELKERVKKAGLTQSEFADKLGISLATLALKNNGKSEWTLSQAKAIRNILNLSEEEFNFLFLEGDD